MKHLKIAASIAPTATTAPALMPPIAVPEIVVRVPMTIVVMLPSVPVPFELGSDEIALVAQSTWPLITSRSLARLTRSQMEEFELEVETFTWPVTLDSELKLSLDSKR